MTTVAIDSFDCYTTTSQRWGTNTGAIGGGYARTGSGGLRLDGDTGIARAICAINNCRNKHDLLWSSFQDSPFYLVPVNGLVYCQRGTRVRYKDE